MIVHSNLFGKIAPSNQDNLKQNGKNILIFVSFFPSLPSLQLSQNLYYIPTKNERKRERKRRGEREVVKEGTNE